MKASRTTLNVSIKGEWTVTTYASIPLTEDVLKTKAGYLKQILLRELGISATNITVKVTEK